MCLFYKLKVKKSGNSSYVCTVKFQTVASVGADTRDSKGIKARL